MRFFSLPPTGSHVPDLPDRIGSSDCTDDFVAFLHRCTVIGRWLVLLLCCLSLGLPALWSLRYEIVLWRSQFTWVALWYSFHAHPWPTFGLSVCLGTLLSTLVWQSRNILWGLSPGEVDRLQQYARYLRHQRTRSTLWLWFQARTDRAGGGSTGRGGSK